MKRKSKNDILAYFSEAVGDARFVKNVRSERGDCDIYRHSDSDGSELGVETFFSVGLSLCVGYELLMSCKTNEADAFFDLIELLLFTIIDDHLHALAGSAIGGGEDLPDLSGMNGFYLTDPVYFAELIDGQIPAWWAFPVFNEEMTLIRSHGGEHFESLLDEDESIDLLSLKRKSACK